MSNELANEYTKKVYQRVKDSTPNETEFHQAVLEVFSSIEPVLDKNPSYEDQAILERLVEPDRMITFQVPWVDDQGQIQVNRGFRVQFDNTLGPYKGGLRFDSSTNPSIIKFLGFEQIFKNALTGLQIGGAKGGADFDPKNKSDLEMMRFCQSFMNELVKYIGADIDIPAGDIGVNSREIGYLFGQYRKLRGGFQAGALTGKAIHLGGISAREEATGYGLIYFLQEMLKEHNLELSGKRVIVSGAGNVSIHAIEKAIEFGATVVACSDIGGYIYNENGLDLATIKELKLKNSDSIESYLDHDSGAKFNSNLDDFWTLPCDIALPCATQNELTEGNAKDLVRNGVIAVAEGANMPSTQKAIDTFLKNDLLFAPAKAANAGGVAVSALEMAQNSARDSWCFEKVDQQLQDIMKTIYHDCVEAADQYNQSNNLVAGANIASFIRVAEGMTAQGII